jgi:hypothetical protein
MKARPDAEQGRARGGVPLIQSEARGERVETIGNTKEVEEESYESREEGSRLLAMRGEGPRGREAEAQARVVCRACASKVFSSARASVVCLARASEDFFARASFVCRARASLVCRARASLLLRSTRLARACGGCRAIRENVLMTVAPPLRASSVSPGLGGRPGRPVGVRLVEFQYGRVVVVEVVCGNPAALFGAVAYPVDQVLKFPAEDTGVEDARDFVFFFPFGVDDGWGWRWSGAGWKSVGTMRFEERGVEDRVNAHGRR